MVTVEKLFVRGLCPVCRVDLIVLVVRPPRERQIVWCPMCELSWDAPPEANMVDELNRLLDLAPSGVRLPTEEDLQGVPGIGTVPYAQWASEIDQVLGKTHRG